MFLEIEDWGLKLKHAFPIYVCVHQLWQSQFQILAYFHITSYKLLVEKRFISSCCIFALII